MNVNDIKAGDILEYENNDYGILNVVTYGGTIYAIANQMQDDDFLDNMAIFKFEDDLMYLVEDEDTLNTLKKLFETNLEKLIKDNL